MKKQQTHTSPVRKLSKKRLLLFKAIAILLPFLLLVIIELLLRAFDYGYNPAVFIEDPANSDYLILNPDASRKYFADKAMATTGNTEPFAKEKAAGTVRIFVLGESTTAGYPYFHNGSFHRWLQYRLMHSMPDTRYEIINLSLTAVNSYTVLGFAKEVVNYEPDAVFIYTGHNEYYGALGVGSTTTIGGNPWLVNTIVGLRRFRLMQWATNVYQWFRGSAKSRGTQAGKTRMELMVAQQEIPFDSDLYKRGVTQFANNLDATLRLFDNKNIPVFVSNLVSNEKDLPPFVDIDPDSLEFPAFKYNYAAGTAALSQSSPAKADSLLQEANKMYGGYASCQYNLGQLALRRGDTSAARRYLSHARDLDALRFRAPAQMNTVIAQLCSKYSHAHLVDTKALYEQHAKDHIIGDELVLEHVHPNLLGYALLSEAFYHAMKKDSILTVPAAQEMSFAQLLLQMPITTMDSLAGEYRIAHLKRNWPFTSKTTPVADSARFSSDESRLAYNIAFKQMNWEDATAELYATYIKTHQLAKAKTLVEGLVLEHPAEETWYTSAANICGELKDYDNALFYFRKSFAMAPTADKARFLFVMNFMVDRPQAAMPYLDYAISNGQPGLQNIKTLATDIIHLQQQVLAKDTANLSALNAIAARYLQMGNKEGASKYVEKVLRLDPHNKEAGSLAAKVK